MPCTNLISREYRGEHDRQKPCSYQTYIQMAEKTDNNQTNKQSERHLQMIWAMEKMDFKATAKTWGK